MPTNAARNPLLIELLQLVGFLADAVTTQAFWPVELGVLCRVPWGSQRGCTVMRRPRPTPKKIAPATERMTEMQLRVLAGHGDMLAVASIRMLQEWELYLRRVRALLELSARSRQALTTRIVRCVHESGRVGRKAERKLRPRRSYVQVSA